MHFFHNPAPVKRLLELVRTDYRKRGRVTTKRGTLLSKHIPITTNQWNEARPGFLDADKTPFSEDITGDRLELGISL